MRRMLVLVGALVFVFASALPAQAVIHEIVAAYCSGGDVGVIDEAGELLPPPLTEFGTHTFARPVIATGAVEEGPEGPVVADHPAAKFPAGTSVFDATHDNADHPSTNCANLPE